MAHTLTSKHFQSLAKSLALTRPPIHAPLCRLEQWQADCQSVQQCCERLAARGSRFDVGKWLDELEKEQSE